MDKTNPKDLLGLKKAPMHLLPVAAKLAGVEAMMDGARKYGPYNWREHPVRMTVYMDAMERHLDALKDMEEVASDSKVSHLGHIIACAAIILDAAACDCLVDDRPAATYSKGKGVASKLQAEVSDRIKAKQEATEFRAEPEDGNGEQRRRVGQDFKDRSFDPYGD